MKLIHSIYEKHGINILIYLYLRIFVRSSQKRLKWLELTGMKVGKSVHLNGNLSTFPDPYMVEIGNDVYIASGVLFCTHDGSYSHITRKIGLTDKRTEKIGKIIVGDNCFIGERAIIMHDVKIGNNCIVAAGAVVTKDVPDSSIVGGNPAKFICTLDDYLERNKWRNDYTCGMSIYDKRRYYENKL